MLFESQLTAAGGSLTRSRDKNRGNLRVSRCDSRLEVSTPKSGRRDTAPVWDRAPPQIECRDAAAGLRESSLSPSRPSARRSGPCVLDVTESREFRYRSTSDRTLLNWPIILALGTGIVAAALAVLGSLFF